MSRLSGSSAGVLPFLDKFLQRREQCRRIRQMRDITAASHQAETGAVGRSVRHAGIREAFSDLTFAPAESPRRGRPPIHTSIPRVVPLETIGAARQ